MKKLFLILLAAAMLFSCEDGKDGKDGKDDPEKDGQLPIVVVSNPSGKIETAFCKKGTVVWATSVDAAWTQTGALSGEVKLNNGFYVVRGSFAGPFISFLVPSGTCFNEAHNNYANNVILRGMEQSSATSHNKNYATSLEYYIGEDHFFDPASAGYGNIPAAFTLAKSEILDYFNFPTMAEGFNELSVTGSTLADAYLLAFETYITDAGEGPDQYNRLVGTGLAILSQDLTYRATVRNFVAGIKVKEVTDNIKAERVNLGFSAEVAPLWNLPLYPEYYADLMTRTPTVLESKNTGYSNNGPIDVADYKIFAYPVQFENSEPKKYISMDMPNAKSIWTVKSCGTYLCPDTKVADLTVLNEVLLEEPVKLQYNYEITGSVPAGQYFIVQEFDTLTAPSKLIEGDATPFGRNIASVDGVTWIGWDNVTLWFMRSIKYVIYD